ncbi:molybdate ABC transporter substrate-binding protein [Streptomonospora litoralis]|uniref:Molybdate-binding periplasmic protein n=1 Tax=Streptomonospora litoralis TaxID=2498135 RepID=A0A4V0ZK66_9ACTN|nr:molybdate ABC transporter substrate-binding protein [Streptomonospora litoralis]QBI55912.1 Molybdate-binding periplasmic protein precursor [Streptomonospora litoralis]
MASRPTRQGDFLDAVRRLLRRGAAAAAAVGVLAAGAACAPVEGGEGSGDTGGGAAQRTLTVFAAASLTEAFEELGGRFEEEHPDARVEFNFAGSSDLANQINEGAPADVFASADTHTMDLVVEEGRTAKEPVVFVRNTLRIAVPADNPAGVDGLADLADPAVKVVLCAEEVPCGAASAEALDAAGLEVAPVSRERDVKAALTKAELGEVDAALVYRTDIRAADGVKGIAFPEADEAANDYPVAVLEGAARPGLAEAWVEFVRSGDGDEVLDDAGFSTL